MRWRGRRESGNIEDRRRVGPGVAVGGLGTIAVVVIAMLLGVDPRTAMRFVGGGGQGSGGTTGTPGVTSTGIPQDDEQAHFVAVVLADTEDVWRQLFAQSRRDYVEPKLVLFRNQVRSACGLADAAVGPFYCPGDQQVYLDLGFFDELSGRFGAPGDFSRAYVVAHEVGHHVQNLLGISERVHNKMQQVSKREANDLSVRLELQADYFAGVWAHHAQKHMQILEAGDLEEAIGAAGAVGDDRLQKQAKGYVVPDSFTHGTSAQRIAWFRRGFESGDVGRADTFAVDKP